LPRELHEVIGGYVLGTQPVRIDQILGYVLVAKSWSQTVFSGPIRLVSFNKHRISIDMLERLAAFDRLSFCLDLRFCQRLGDDEDFLDIMQYHNIYELDLRGVELKYEVNPDLGHLTSLRRLAISHFKDKPASKYTFISKLTRLNSLIIQQDGYGVDESSTKLDLNYLLPLTNLKELALHPLNEQITIVDPVTQLISLKTLILNCGNTGFEFDLDPTKLTALTNLQVLSMRGIAGRKEEEIRILSNIKWQTSLQRIYFNTNDKQKVVTDLAKFSPIWFGLPEKKFQAGESLYMDVFNTHYKASFY
jgi:hypothetical protein